METRKDAVMPSLTPQDVEVWLDDNVDWLCDYLRRRQSTLDDRWATQSRHGVVPAQFRNESTLRSPWHSRSHSAASEQVLVTSSRITSPSRHHCQQQQITKPTRSPDYTTTLSGLVLLVSHTSSSDLHAVVSLALFNSVCQSYQLCTSPDYTATSPSLFVMTSDGSGRRSSAIPLLPSQVHPNSKKHLRRHFAKSRTRLADDQFITSETSSASFDWFVSYSYND